MSQRGYSKSALCGLLGISRNGYYKHSGKDSERHVLLTSIVMYCRWVRSDDRLPKAGCRELLVLCREYFGEKFNIGRDRFYDVLRSNGLMLRQKRYRVKTTFSHHHFRIYEDLLNTSPKFLATACGQMAVADITYVRYRDGFLYLSLLTDCYSRYIIGWCLKQTLETEGPLEALRMGLAFYESQRISTKVLIHHSDRGIQYASFRYTGLLRMNGIRISMTQCGDPLHNALAERMNNTVKNSWPYAYEDLGYEDCLKALGNAILMYNTARPHSALGMRTPYEVVTGTSVNPLHMPAMSDLEQMSLGGASPPADSIPQSVFHS
ncbi:MAG: IS3 family transposase [Clostridia bacterium]|nr:IS3 family transposase [Clostridia bacterium]